MDKRDKAAERAKREDAILNRVLIWIAGSVVFEALLLLLNRYYVEYDTTEEILIAKGIYDATGVLSFVLPVCFVGALIWWVLSRRKSKKTLVPQIVTTILALLSVSAILTHFFVESGVKALYVGVPCVAVLALVYYLYQREFFVVMLVGAVSLLGLWMLSKRPAHGFLVYAYLIVELAALVAAILVIRKLQDGRGVLRFRDHTVQCFPGNANYILLYLTFLVSVAVQAAGFCLGPVAVLYAVEIVWLLAMAVYYTVRLM
ncbi:hypothetical protein H7U37_07225 [Pseudoflavonifractor phocaeensis]|uniref:hypothetical protein n=1 Tax=Pseudoflavonifractor phocaeensis TaxID=1870988 RepID=UPI001959FED6|nr:hypothetical protein [Pseudoflavonifractor phocaeensis]MBM6870969.1 hypothetical protein [Pseudoflavonifractor phocaeensis]MBM6938324.1 hypothetical protein [Pseudoflavonifractor phocaeensis]